MALQIPDTTNSVNSAGSDTDSHIQPVHIRGSITSNCHRENPTLLKTIKHQQRWEWSLQQHREVYFIFIFLHNIAQHCVWTRVSGSIHSFFHFLYPSIFNLGAKELLMRKWDQLLWQKWLQIRGQQLIGFLYQQHTLNASKNTSLSEINQDNLFQNILQHHPETVMLLLT